MSRDYTGVETTCGDINDTINVIDRCIDILKEVFDNQDSNSVQEVIQDLKDLYISDKHRGLYWPKLEELRKANADLRDFGNSTYKELVEVKEELERANDKVSDLEDEVQELKKELEKINP